MSTPAFQPYSELTPVNARRVVRCEFCHLTQFFPQDQHCRRCHKSLNPEDYVVTDDENDAGKRLQDAGDVVRRSDTLDVGLTLWLLRMARSVSQREVADAMGVPRTYVSKVENHKALPTLSQMRRIADALDVPIFVLIVIATSGIGSCPSRTLDAEAAN